MDRIEEEGRVVFWWAPHRHARWTACAIRVYAVYCLYPLPARLNWKQRDDRQPRPQSTISDAFASASTHLTAHTRQGIPAQARSFTFDPARIDIELELYVFFTLESNPKIDDLQQVGTLAIYHTVYPAHHTKERLELDHVPRYTITSGDVPPCP